MNGVSYSSAAVEIFADELYRMKHICETHDVPEHVSLAFDRAHELSDDDWDTANVPQLIDGEYIYNVLIPKPLLDLQAALREIGYF